MGNIQSQFPAAHVRIYQNLIQVRDYSKRLEVIETLLAGNEYIQSAKRAGIYSNLLAFITKVKRGEQPDPLPGEGQQQQKQQQKQTALTVQSQRASGSAAEERWLKPHGKEKAIGYFQSSLEILGLEEEVALTEESLKIAYRKAALRTHPDKKGGSEKAFELVTRAYAYLTEILRRIHGGRAVAGKVEAPEIINTTRKDESKAWQMVEPVKLNPQKLDMNAFNKMFEQTRIPDPEDDGYGDWLTSNEAGSAAASGKKFGEKFNRDVFNKMFEEQSRSKQQQPTQLMNLGPQAMMLAPNHGVELGRDRPNSYTAAANASLKYTDLKQAYTVENTISGQVSDVRVDPRNIKDYTAQRKRAPDPYSHEEAEALAASERMMAEKEKQRQLRAAHEDTFAGEYFERMKRLVITDKSSGTESTSLVHRR
jgi:curved DNA-binding protein CbpA